MIPSIFHHRAMPYQECKHPTKSPRDLLLYDTRASLRELLNLVFRDPSDLPSSNRMLDTYWTLAYIQTKYVSQK